MTRIPTNDFEVMTCFEPRLTGFTSNVPSFQREKDTNMILAPYTIHVFVFFEILQTIA